MIKNFPIRLRELRLGNGLSQRELADYLNIHPQYLSNIERGIKSVTLPRLIEIADFFNVSLDYLVGQSAKPTPFAEETEKNEINRHTVRNFSTRLKFLREKNRLTQQQLADYIGVTNCYVSGMESGKEIPSVKKLIVISDMFNVSIDYLVGRTDTVEVI